MMNAEKIKKFFSEKVFENKPLFLLLSAAIVIVFIISIAKNPPIFISATVNATEQMRIIHTGTITEGPTHIEGCADSEYQKIRVKVEDTKIEVYVIFIAATFFPKNGSYLIPGTKVKFQDIIVPTTSTASGSQARVLVR